MNTILEQTQHHKKGVILLSGGLDSAVCLSIADQVCDQIYALFLKYGQKTLEREQQCAESLTRHFKRCVLKILDASFLGEVTGAALCKTDSTVTRANEYVPFRNGIFLAIATAAAEAVDADIIYIGSTGGDLVCRDNSKEFRADFEKITESGTNAGKKIKIAAPLEIGNKEYVVRKGAELKTPF